MPGGVETGKREIQTSCLPKSTPQEIGKPQSSESHASVPLCDLGGRTKAIRPAQISEFTTEVTEDHRESETQTPAALQTLAV